MKSVIRTIIHWEISHPKTILGILAFITLVALYLASNIRFDFTIEQLFAMDDPEVDAYFQFREDFGREDRYIFLVYECQDPFSYENLKTCADLTKRFESIIGIEEVTSITNVELFTQSGDLILSPVFDVIHSDRDSILVRKERIISSPFYRSSLVSADEKLGSFILSITDIYNTHEERERILSEISTIQAMSLWQWHEAGIPVLRTRYVQYMLDDYFKFMLPISVVLVSILFLLFRTIRGVLLPIFTVIIADLWAVAIMVMLGFTINIITYIMPTLILIVGVADSIHILVKYHEELEHTSNKQTAVFQTLKKIGTAIFLTSLTTAVGFLSLMTTNIVIVKQFGLIVAIAVIVAFLVSIIFVPSFLVLLSKPSADKLLRRKGRLRHRLILSIIRMNDRYKKSIVGLSLIVLLTALFLALKIDPHGALLEDIKPGNKLYEDMHFMDTGMGSVLPFEVIVTAVEKGEPREDEFKEPFYLHQVDALQKKLNTIPEIGKVISLVDYVREIHKAWNGGDPEFQTIPDTRHKVSNLLFGQEETLESLVDVFDYSKIRISARIGDVTSKRASEISQEITEWVKEYLPENLKVQLTGTTLLALKTNQYLVRNLVGSFILAFGVIFITMLVLFRSLKLAALSMIPNIIPILIMAATMGAFHIILRPTTAMTFAVAFGIAVDDTIHYLARFRQELFVSRGNYRKANQQTLITTGKAIISTSIILIAGFLVLTLSNFLPSIHFGFLASMTMFAALMGDLLFLPSIILLVRPSIPFLRNM